MVQWEERPSQVQGLLLLFTASVTLGGSVKCPGFGFFICEMGWEGGSPSWLLNL